MALYFIGLLLSSSLLFGPFVSIPPRIFIYLYSLIGLFSNAIFATLTFYLPEIFVTRIRATGCGFCYNLGRLFASPGPFIVGTIASGDSIDAVSDAIRLLFYLGFVALVPLFILPLSPETKDRPLLN